MLLENKKIFVTGGCQGIGFGCAKKFIEEGAKVTIMDYADEEKLAEVKEKLGENCFVIHGNVTKSEDVKKAVDYAVEMMGGLDGAVNNAGGGQGATIMEATDESFDFVVKLCLHGTFYSVREEAKVMKENGGSIVNMSSLNASFTSQGAVSYNSAKAGVDALTKTAALEMGKYGIRVNSIRPGFTMTEGLSGALAVPGYTEIVMEKCPMNRYGKPEDVANLAAFLLSDNSTYITGAIHTIDGGMETTGYPNVQKAIDALLAQMAAQQQG